MNAVDTDYRSQLRELNELNFARFDAKVEQRFAQFETRLTTRMFVFYTGQTVGLAALICAMLHGR